MAMFYESTNLYRIIFIEPLYAPMDPIYCTRFDEFNTSSCFVRIGNTLAYPVINHYGWSSDGYGRPTRCARSTASVAGSAANYYCSMFQYFSNIDDELRNVCFVF